MNEQTIKDVRKLLVRDCGLNEYLMSPPSVNNILIPNDLLEELKSRLTNNN